MLSSAVIEKGASISLIIDKVGLQVSPEPVARISLIVRLARLCVEQGYTFQKAVEIIRAEQALDTLAQAA